MQREPKKTDFIEVRVSTETKTAFMAACQANRTSASAVLRGFIGRYVRSASGAPRNWRQELHMLKRGRATWRTATAAGSGILVIALAVATTAGPAQAASDARLTAAFEWMDRNHDGRVSPAEFAHAESNSPPLGALGIVIDTRTRPDGEARGDLFARLDGDHDKSLTLAELIAEVVVTTVATPGIAAADANRDGALGEGELAAYLVASRAASGVGTPSNGAGAIAASIVAEHDADGDGKLLLAELNRQPR